MPMLMLDSRFRQVATPPNMANGGIWYRDGAFTTLVIEVSRILDPNSNSPKKQNLLPLTLTATN
jgi:hypothetical protein